MAKTKTVFFCKDCGNESPRWAGQCTGCGAWNTIVEAPAATTGRRSGTSHYAGVTTSARVRLQDISAEHEERIPSGISEFDFVLGGGIVRGGGVLVGGDPGIGKSTLLLQIAGNLQAQGRKVLYASGEESPSQVRMRSDRLGGGSREIEFVAESDVSAILRHAEECRPAVLIVDSIQTIVSDTTDGAAGGTAQVRESAARLLAFAKQTGTALFLIGHVTKEGSIAGPKTLEHMVDAVLYFESGEMDCRIVRAVKNRFGSLDEIAVFRMSGAGLEVISNPSEFFLSQRRADMAGSVVVPVMEGTRPLLVEVQALAALAAYGSPQRIPNGFDHKRLSLLLAVLEKKAGYMFSRLDAFLNVVGGLKISEPAIDAGVAVALASAAQEMAIGADTIVMGEIGLGGELRAIPYVDRRINEAVRMGFTRIYLPAASAPRANVPGAEIIAVHTINELLIAAVGPVAPRVERNLDEDRTPGREGAKRQGGGYGRRDIVNL